MRAFVLVNPLDLNVEQPVRIQFDPRRRANVVGKAFLVGMLDRAPPATERGVVGVRLKVAKPPQLHRPPVPDGVVKQLSKPRVGKRQEPAWRDTVGLVAEPLWPQLIEVLEHTGCEKLRVQRGYSVDGVTA